MLGDGSIMPYRVNPTANTVSHAAQFPAGASSFTVTAEAGSYVGISQNNVLLGAALVPDGGSVDVPVGSVTSGEVKIVVTKPQRQPYIQTIPVGGPAPQQYTITTLANPVEGGTVTGGNTYAQGAQCTLVATANEGYTFVNWTVATLPVSTQPSITFQVTGNAEYVANFQPQTFEVTATASPAEGGTVTGGNTYAQGTQCTLTATANTGYDFINWTKDGTEVSNSKTYTFVVTEAADYVANFELHRYDITAVTDPVNSGYITMVGDNTYGSSITITVEPAENFVFDYWTENDVIISHENEYNINFIVDDHHIVAHLRDVTSVGENAQQTLNIYPNPVSDKLFIEAKDAISNVEIYNLTGAKVIGKECNSDKVEMEVGELQSGIYFIRMTTANTTETRRFVKE